MKKLFLSLCAIALLAACSEQEVIDEVEPISDSEEEVSRIISQDEAISTLMAFLEDTELATRSGKGRTISSVSVYSKPVTRVQMEDATESPSAYLVNFDDDYVYMQHFRLVTYDRPLDHKVMTVSFKMPEE